MRVKHELDFEGVRLIAGKASMNLAKSCPDGRVTFPERPCTNLGCPYAIKQPGYMNCTYVGSETGNEHTLEAVGEMIGVTREGIRLIEKRALLKIRAALSQGLDNESTVHKQVHIPGTDRVPSDDEGPEPEDEHRRVSARYGRVMANA